MDMAVHVRGDVLIIEPSGPVRLYGEDELPALIASLLERRFLNFLLNLHRVHCIDCMGLGSIVRAFATVSRKGGRLKLLNVQKRVRELLDVMKLSTVFEMFDSEEHALRSFDGFARSVSACLERAV
jgi:anti-sigma B factor antagonist